MKRFLKFSLFIGLILISTLAFPQDSTSIVTQTYHELRSDVIKILEGPGKHVLELAIKQCKAEAIGNLVVSFILTIGLLFSVAFCAKRVKEDDVFEPPMVIIALVSILVVVWFFCAAYNIFIVFSNPEYAGIKELLNNIK